MTHDPIGFTAADPEAAYYDDGDVIQIPTIIYNEGNYYNNDTSIFTCPVTGVYMFSLSMRNAYTYYARGAIMLEANAIAVANSNDASNDHPQETATNVVIEKCDAGQRVWVRMQCRQNSETENARRVIFSGFLIQQYLKTNNMTSFYVDSSKMF